MKWAVYTDNPNNSLECIFYKTREEALAAIENLISQCESESGDAEKNLFWDITLLEVKGECAWGPDGLVLVTK